MNISVNTSEAEFKSALLDQLTNEEKQKFTLYSRLAPACADPGAQTAIFKFKPLGPPSFLENERPSFTHQGRDIVVDTDFFGLTQLYPVVPSEIKIE